MPDLFIPGARQQWQGVYGWSLNGGPRKAILHSTETDPGPGAVNTLCRYLDGWANPHVVWDPWSGDMAMCGRADWAGGALKAGNRDGSVVLQVEAIGRAGVAGSRPFVDSPMRGWDKILAWFDSWQIPRVFPAGPSPAYPQQTSDRPWTVWQTQSGYWPHANVPGNDHGDPGVVDLAKIFPGNPNGDIDVTMLPTLDFTQRAVGKVVSLRDPHVRKVLGLLWAVYPQDQVLVEPPGSGGKPLNPTQKLAYAEHEVRAFQGYHGLEVDGIVGQKTWSALVAA